MTLHKLFKELQKLSYEDYDLLCDAWREYWNIKTNCRNMGIKYRDKFLINAITKISNSKCVQTSVSSNISSRNKKIEQIILGDNLDIVERLAKEKGII